MLILMGEVRLETWMVLASFDFKVRSVMLDCTLGANLPAGMADNLSNESKLGTFNDLHGDRGVHHDHLQRSCSQQDTDKSSSLLKSIQADNY